MKLSFAARKVAASTDRNPDAFSATVDETAGLVWASGNNKEADMAQPFPSSPALALGAGLLVLMKPKLLNYIVAAYLISDGLLRLMERRT